MHVRDAFGLIHPSTSDQHARQQQQQVGPNNVVTITDVAWSGFQNNQSNTWIPQALPNKSDNSNSFDQYLGSNNFVGDHSHNQNTSKLDEGDDDSLLAAAGSNGVVVIWRVSNLLHGKATAPEAVLLGHSRAVNKVAWHPEFINNTSTNKEKSHQKNVLLTASQDSTIKIWDRLISSSSITKDQNDKNPSNISPSGGVRSWWGGISSMEDPNNSKVNNHQSFIWHCAFTFQPKSEPVRDIQWDPFHSNGRNNSRQQILYTLTKIFGSLTSILN